MAKIRRDGAEDDGFTLVELLVAVTIIAGVMLSVTYLLFGALGAYGAARQRSGVVEYTNGVMESLRALPYGDVGVLATDPNFSVAYPGGEHNGRDAVDDAGAGAPPAVETITTPPAEGVPVPLTIRRWVTWTDPDGGDDHVFKRLDVQATWKENSGLERTFSLSSLLYKGTVGGGTSTTNSAPIAGFTFLPSTPSAGTSVQFTSVTTDADGDPLTYGWVFPDTTSTVAAPTYTFPFPGDYTVTLSVSDGRGGSDVEIRTVSVTATNEPPTAVFDDPVRTLPGRQDAIAVDGSASSDPEGGPLSFSWDWGDGSAASSGSGPTHRYLTTGTFTITLTVTDPGGRTASASRDYTVNVVGCTIISGSFRNGTSTVDNEIEANGQGRPNSPAFTFSAQTTEACSSLSANLPLADGLSFDVLLNTPTTSGQKTWTASTNAPSTARFNLGSGQTWFMKSPANSGSIDTFRLSFNVV